MNATGTLPPQRLIRLINRVWFWVGLPEIMRPHVPPKAGFRGGVWPAASDVGTDTVWFGPPWVGFRRLERPYREDDSHPIGIIDGR